MKSSSTKGGALAALWVLCLSGAAQASTFVMPTDEELLERSPVVVLARVSSIAPAPDAGIPATEYWVDIERPLKGFAPAGTIVVRVPGGVRRDGIAMHVYGSPALRSGERAVLFLEPHSSGTYRVVDLALGVFHEVASGGQRLAIRQLEGTTELRLPGDPKSLQRSRASQPRSFDRFVDWLADRASGVDREADYFTTRSAVSRRPPSFNTTKSPTQPPPIGCGPAGGNHVRWTAFDRNEPVTFYAHEAGQKGVPGGGFAEAQVAMETWSADPESSVRLAYGGTSDRTTGGLDVDGFNMILFEDPLDVLPGEFNGVGTVAVATVFFDCNVLHAFFGGIAHSLIEADIITQNGAGSFFFSLADQPGVPFGEIVGHELGHGTGLAHACGDGGSGECFGDAADALMRAFVHNDGRGPRLGVDDLAGIRFLYGQGATGAAPAAPSELTAVASGTDSIDLQWTDQSGDEEAFDIEMRTASGEFSLAASVVANVTATTISGFDEASYRIFRVRARNSQGSSNSSAEAAATTLGEIGPCVEDDHNLCLNDDRFRVSALWATVLDTAGSGVGAEITGDTGTFWFFDPGNVELVVKVLDACGFNQAFWAFAGGLTNVLVELTVVDTETGASKTYINPQLTEFQPIQDTAAFFTCP